MNMPDTTFLATADHYDGIEKADARDSIEKQAKDEIVEAILAGRHIQCAGYKADPEDFAYFCATKIADFGQALTAFANGELTADEFKRYVTNAIGSYADLHYIARADYLEQN